MLCRIVLQMVLAAMGGKAFPSFPHLSPSLAGLGRSVLSRRIRRIVGIMEQDQNGYHFLFFVSRNKTFLRTGSPCQHRRQQRDQLQWDIPIGSYFNMLIMGAVLGRLKV